MGVCFTQGNLFAQHCAQGVWITCAKGEKKRSFWLHEAIIAAQQRPCYNGTTIWLTQYVVVHANTHHYI
jgi:hypothetical protein